MLETLWRKLQWSSLPPTCAISTASPQRSKLNILLEGKHTFFLAMSAFFLLSLLDSPVSINHHKIWLKDELNFGHGKKWGFFLLIYVTPPPQTQAHLCAGMTNCTRRRLTFLESRRENDELSCWSIFCWSVELKRLNSVFFFFLTVWYFTDILNWFCPNALWLGPRAHICHRYHRLYPWRKNCHVEKFGLSIKKFEQFMEFYQSLCRFCSKSVWRKICVEKKWQLRGRV